MYSSVLRLHASLMVVTANISQASLHWLDEGKITIEGSINSMLEEEVKMTLQVTSLLHQDFLEKFVLLKTKAKKKKKKKKRNKQTMAE